MDIFTQAQKQHPAELAAFISASHTPTAPAYKAAIAALATRTTASARAIAAQHPHIAEAIIKACDAEMRHRTASALCATLQEQGGNFQGDISYYTILHATN